ncbi:MAG: hypothetical protein KBD16_02535 [Candidatus Pacebacteria bacterium]|nr:hypothetical protein [Candidatus Paceibacterota bacterium]
MHSFSKKEALRFGWNTFKARPWIFIGAAALLMVISMIFNKLTQGREDILTFVIAIVGTLVQWWLFIGFTRMTLHAHAGTPVVFKTLFGESWKTLLQYAIIAVLSGILVGIGLVLLVVPGIIVYTMIALAPFFLLERGMKGIDAMKESRRVTEGHRMNLFLFVLILAALNILGALALWVGLLVTIPVSLLAFVYVFKQIEKGIALAPQAPVGTPVAPTGMM